MKRNPTTPRLFLSLAALLLAASMASANDRDLLYTKRAAPADVMIVVSNTDSMATCMPGQSLPNSQTCPSSGTLPLAPDGFSDGPNSKMGIAKSAIVSIIRQFPTTFNFGLSSFSVSRQNLNSSPKKRYVFQSQSDDFTGVPFNTPSGTLNNFGAPIGSPTTLTDGATTYTSLPWATNGIPTWVQDTSGTTGRQPYGGADGTTKVILYNLETGSSVKSLNNKIDKGKEIVLSITSTTYQAAETNNGSYRIHYDDGDKFTVTETVYQCDNGNALAAAVKPSTCGSAVATSTIDYKVPTGWCSETNTSCTYPTIYGYGSQLREEMGWINFVDANSSMDQSGWLQQSNSNPQPVVMIAHDYSPWTPYSGYAPSGVAVSGKVQYAENSNPCILRSMRPSSSIVDNTTLTESDHFPIFTAAAGETCASGNCQSQCDKMVDGLFQTGEFPAGGTNEITPVIFPRGDGGGGPPLSKLLGTGGVYTYFNGGASNACSAAGGGTDGFCAGVRPDDPFKNCRQSAVILISDVLTMGSPALSFSINSAPSDSGLNKLKAINVPVFVIGFALTASGTPATNQCLLKSGAHGNTGECIAENTGATTYNGTTVLRQGYYLADTAAKLAAALTAVLNSLNTNTRDFATATIPSVSATSGGIAYLSQFNPRNNRSIWEGHLRAYFLDPTTGLVQSLAGKPDPTAFTFWTGASPASGSILWDAGNSPSGADTTSTLGNLDGIRNVDPTLLLTSSPGAGGAWSDTTHDQKSGVVGRNVFFGVKPGDAGCTGGTLSYECLAQVPVGTITAGTSPSPTYPTEPGTGWVVPSPPATLPGWWTTAQGSSYVNIPATPLEGSGNADQALQNSFSFARGNRDPVVEAFKLSSKFDATHTKCSDGTGTAATDLAKDADSPCYYGDTMGDLFHSNPTVVSSPTNFRYYFSQDPGTATAGTYADRGNSYQTFQSDHAHRRKILYAGANDGALHAFDIGVFNGDTSTYNPGTGSICPLCGRYSFGSGREIFAYLPRAGLNKIYNLAHTLSYNWTIDGPPSIDDVYIDVTRVGTSSSPQGVAPSGAGADSDVSGASPNSTSHAWRTVLIGTEREGGLDSDGGGIVSSTSGKGGSVFALDVTDPDQTAHMKSSWTGIATGQTPIRGVPECIVANFTPMTDSPPSNCTAPFPRILWEIRDDQSTTTTAPYRTELGTSSAATTQDLGMTWSQPVIGRVKITVGSGSRDFFVAIFGGGYDHTAATLAATNVSGNTGNFLYMADIETGRIIYKKNLGPWSSGASGTSTAGNLAAGVPGTPGVIDINGDGYLDTIYVGDTQGRLWKVDLTPSATLSNSTSRITDGQWEPVMFFDEYLNSTVQSTKPRQPIFDQPAAFFAGNTSTGQPKIGIAFGTGDRDNMPVLTDTNPNFFVVLVDPPSRAQAVDNDHPLTLADLTLASLTANNCNSSNCLNANGYYLSLPVGSSGAQIVNTDPLIFNQQIFFNTFLHSETAGDCNELGVPYVYILDYATGKSAQTDSNGNVVANTTGPSGAEVLSSDIIFTSGGGANALAMNVTDNGQKVNVTSSADSTAQDPVKTGGAPTVKIKSWKEQ